MFALSPGMGLSHAVMFANDPLQAERMTFGMGTDILVIIWFQHKTYAICEQIRHRLTGMESDVLVVKT